MYGITQVILITEHDAERYVKTYHNKCPLHPTFQIEKKMNEKENRKVGHADNNVLYILC